MPENIQNKNIGFAVKNLSRKLGRTLDKRLSDTKAGGITGVQAMIICYLAKNPERDIFQRDIECHFNIRRSTVTGILKTMESNGLVKRISVERDARLKKLVLTQKAIEMHRVIERQVSLLESEISAAFTPDELERFFDFLARMENVLE